MHSQMTFEYGINRTWSDCYLPQIKSIVGAHLLATAPDNLDMKHATDLLMLDARDMRIARITSRRSLPNSPRWPATGSSARIWR